MRAFKISAALLAGLIFSNAIAGAADLDAEITNNVDVIKQAAEEAGYLELSPEDIEKLLDASHLGDYEKSTLRALEKYTDMSNATFDYGAALADNAVDQKIVKDYAIGLKSSGWELVGTGGGIADIETKAHQLRSEFNAPGTCGGVNGYQFNPPAILIDSCIIKATEHSESLGVGFAGPAGMLTHKAGVGPTTTGAITAILASESAAARSCNATGNGIRVFADGHCESQ